MPDSSFDFSNVPLHIKCSNCSHCKNPFLLEHGVFEEATCYLHCELVSSGKSCEFSFNPPINRI